MPGSPASPGLHRAPEEAVVSDTSSRIPELLKNNEKEILARWVERLLASQSYRPELLPEHELRLDAADFLEALRHAVQTGNLRDIDGPDWARARDVLAASRSRARQGLSPTETALFVFSIKEPLFELIRRDAGDPRMMAEDIQFGPPPSSSIL